MKRGILGFLIALMSVAGRGAQTNTLLLEAEEFRAGGAWEKISVSQNYYAATLANTFSSRGKLLSAPEQCRRSVATLKARIPADGIYRIWTRYECPAWWGVEHTLRIEQGGGLVFERTTAHCQIPGYGRLAKASSPWSIGIGAAATTLFGNRMNAAWR